MSQFNVHGTASGSLAVRPPDPNLNPYLGPRAFGRGKTLYGRDRERWDLRHLLVAERVVLLHSASGAGKTSLLESAVIPDMMMEGYLVLPTIRVGLGTGAERDQSDGNRYLASALASLEARFPVPVGATAKLAQYTLTGYLDEICSFYSDEEQAQPRLLVFDQFEEIVSLDPTDDSAKRAFFAQLAATLRDRRYSAVFSVREEFLGGLDPYSSLLPTGFSRRYRLELLRPGAALEAIQGPAKESGVQFDDDVAERLVENLGRFVVLLPDGSTKDVAGSPIEPVQLQVVCQDLWDIAVADWMGSDRTESASISAKHLPDAASVDQALSRYYATRVKRVSDETGVSEQSIRDWFDARLISGGRLRNQVLLDRVAEGEISRAVVDGLVNMLLLRIEERRRLRWCEITHDRLVDPILEDNRQWFITQAPRIRQAADLWKSMGSQPKDLPSYSHIRALLAEPDVHEESLSPLERQFIAASRSRSRTRLHIRAAVIVLLSSTVGWAVYVSQANRQTQQSYLELGFEKMDLEKELQSRTYAEIPRQVASVADLPVLPSVRYSVPRSSAPETFGPAEQSAEQSAALAALPSIEAFRASARSLHLVIVGTDPTGEARRSMNALGFRTTYRADPSGVPNTLTFGDLVPLSVVRAVALHRLASNSPIHRVRRFARGERTREIELNHEAYVQDWAPLTVSQINRLLPPAPAGSR